MTKTFVPAADYTKVHNAIFKLYTRLPDFKAEHALFYVYLVAQHNDEYGYAFPSTYHIALALNCSERAVSGYKDVLKRRGLVEIMRAAPFHNDVYYVKAPITDEAEFYERFPEAREYYERRTAAFDRRRASGKERKRAYDERRKPKDDPGEIDVFSWL